MMTSYGKPRRDSLEHVGEEKKVDVCVCSISQMNTVQGLIQQIEEDMVDVVKTVKFQTLPYNIRDIDAFDFRGIDVLLLCHSIENRGFSLTNVTGALYDRFLKRAKNYVGKSRVGVIAHDFTEVTITGENLTSQMKLFRHNQETTFTSSSVVLIGGRLNQVPVQLNQEQLNELKQFFRLASSDCLRRLRYICMKMCPCCRPRQDVRRLADNTRDYGSLHYFPIN